MEMINTNLANSQIPTDHPYKREIELIESYVFHGYTDKKSMERLIEKVSQAMRDYDTFNKYACDIEDSALHFTVTKHWHYITSVYNLIMKNYRKQVKLQEMSEIIER